MLNRVNSLIISKEYASWSINRPGCDGGHGPPALHQPLNSLPLGEKQANYVKRFENI